MNITIDEVVQAYVETRTQIELKTKELEEALKPLKELQEKREQYLNQQMHHLGVQNLKTPHGTAYFSTKESVTCGDWDTFLGYVQSSGQWNLLNHAVNKTAALEIMGEKRENPPPAGVNYVAIKEVRIRKN